MTKCQETHMADTIQGWNRTYKDPKLAPTEDETRSSKQNESLHPAIKGNRDARVPISLPICRCLLRSPLRPPHFWIVKEVVCCGKALHSCRQASVDIYISCDQGNPHKAVEGECRQERLPTHETRPQCEETPFQSSKPDWRRKWRWGVAREGTLDSQEQ